MSYGNVHRYISLGRLPGTKWLNIAGQETAAWVRGAVFNDNGSLSLRTLSELFVSSLMSHSEGHRETVIQNVLNELNGSFAVVCASEDMLFAAVDRLRSIPLFYGVKNGDVYLSDNAYWVRGRVSEKEVNETACRDFLFAGYVTGRDTIFHGVSQLQAGEYLLVSRKGMQTSTLKARRYFYYLQQDVFDPSTRNLVREHGQVVRRVFERLLADAEGRTLVIPLSGGLDSRLIAVMAKLIPHQSKVICFSYGHPGNRESMKGRAVAEALGYDWAFVPYSRESWRRWFQSDFFRNYFYTAGGLSSLPCVQDFPAVRELQTSGKLPADSIFIPGHSGDFLAGSHIPVDLLSREKANIDGVTDEIYRRHYILSGPEADLTDVKRSVKERIRCTLPVCFVDSPSHAVNLFECWDWQERQAKFIVNSCRTYEYMGYEWRIPFWDNEEMDFWSKVPLHLRIEKKLYREYLAQTNYYGLFNDADTATYDGKNILKTAVKKKMTAYAMIQKGRKCQESLFRYWNDPYRWFGIISAAEYYKRYRKVVHVNSILVKRYLETVLRMNGREYLWRNNER